VALGLAAASLVGCGEGDSGPSPETSRQLRASLSQYDTYLEKNSAKLVHWAGTIVLKVKEGAATKAASRYAAARVPYGHVAPAAQIFPALNTRIDALETDVPAERFGGFHRIEQAIFRDETTTGMTPVAKQLRIDLEALQRRIDASDLQPAQIVQGAGRVLEQALISEIPGKAERYSGTGLTAIAAQTEGVDAALEAVKPLLAEENPELLTGIEAELRKLYAQVEQYGTLAREPVQARAQEPGISFVVYSELSPEAIRELARPIESLAELVGEAEAELGGS
jgi:iron uptake system component EfeO